MAEGLIFRDSDDNRIVLEYSDEVPPVAAAMWNEVAELQSVTQAPNEAAEIDRTHLQSTTVETKRGLGDPGAWNARCNFVPTAANGSPPVDETHATIIGLWESGQERWWRVTWPKVDVNSVNQAQHLWFGSVSNAGVEAGGHTDGVDLVFTMRTAGGFAFTPEERPA